MCENYNRQYGCDFISVMPTNLYGPNDNYDLETAHVLPALLRKFHEAKMQGKKTVEVWGTGTPLREFLHVDNLAEACSHLMQTYKGNTSMNIGTGKDISVKELAELIQEIVGYKGEIIWNKVKPDGPPRKLLDVSLIHGLGWKHKIGLEEGIKEVYMNKFMNQNA
jgi:GDP-L-fucose synthase